MSQSGIILYTVRRRNHEDHEVIVATYGRLWLDTKLSCMVMKYALFWL